MTALSCTDDELVCLDQQGVQFSNRVIYVDYAGIADSSDECNRIRNAIIERLKTPGKNVSAIILRNHGAITIGKNAAEAFVRMVYLEMACEYHMMTRGNQRPMPDQVVQGWRSNSFRFFKSMKKVATFYDFHEILNQVWKLGIKSGISRAKPKSRNGMLFYAS